MRNEEDLNTLSCPPKYRAMHDFWKYYSGQAVAPVLTLFVGGNHEASAHLQELYVGRAGGVERRSVCVTEWLLTWVVVVHRFYGGWAAPNIYYLGAAGVVNVGGLRIAGLSGIYKDMDYRMGMAGEGCRLRACVRV